MQVPLVAPVLVYQTELCERTTEATSPRTKVLLRPSVTEAIVTAGETLR